MSAPKLPLKQGNKELYKINGKVRLATPEKAKAIKALDISVTKVK